MMFGKLQRAHHTSRGHFTPAYLGGSNKLRAYLCEQPTHPTKIRLRCYTYHIFYVFFWMTPVNHNFRGNVFDFERVVACKVFKGLGKFIIMPQVCFLHNFSIIYTERERERERERESMIDR